MAKTTVAERCPDESVAKTTVAQRCPDESLANTTVAERCPDESVANTTVLDSTDGEVRSMAQGEYKLFQQSAMQVRMDTQQSHHTHSKLFQVQRVSNLEPFDHEVDALPSPLVCQHENA